jgi:hypothetical protein
MSGEPPKRNISDNIITAIISALGGIFVALIVTYKGDAPPTKKESPDVSTLTHSFISSDAKNVSMWNDSKDTYLWFNAQYKLANELHEDNHYDSIVKQHIKFTFILIEPNKSNVLDYKNFQAKFKDFRHFLTKMNKQGKEKRYDVYENMKDIYLFQEETIPSVSFFITKSRASGKEKAIVYFEEKYLITDRKPDFCMQTYDMLFIRALKTRASELTSSAQNKNKLSFDEIVSPTYPDEHFYLQK